MAVSKKSEKELVDENKVLRSRLEGLERSEAECKKAGNSLQETTQFLEAILDTTHILIAYLDPQFNFIKVNKAYALADEKEPPFFPGKNHFDLYPNEENEAIFRRVVETGESYFADAKPFAYAGYPERGFSYWDWSLIPINNQHKSVTGLVLSLANVTERELAEEALKAEKAFIETALNAQQDTFFVFKPSTGRAVRWNKVFNDVSGFSDEEIRSMKVPDGYYNEEDLKKAVATTEKIRNEGIATVELSLVTKDGKAIPTEYTASAINDNEGNLRYIIAIGRDITERKKTEEALRDSEGKLQAMLRSLVDHMSMIDNDLNIIWANETAKKLFGDDIVGMKCYKAYHGRNKPCEPYPCLTLKAFQDGKVHEHDTQVVDKNGNAKYFHCSANVALRDEEGNPTGVLEISENITERKLDQEALKESEEKFRSLAEQSPNMIFINKKGKVVYANKKCEEKMGYTREEFYSPDFDFINLIAPESLEKMKDIIKRRSEGEDIKPYEYTLITKTGKRIEAINSSKLIQYEGQTAVLGIVTDITDRKLAEDTLRESENRYRVVVENAVEGIVVVQGQTLQFVNPGLVSMIGYSEKELLTRPFLEFIHPEQRKWVMEIHNKRLKGEEVPSIYELKVLDKKGNVKWLENNGILIKWRDKPATLNFLRDVTERKQAEEELRIKDNAIASSINAITIAEFAGNLTYVNEAFLRMWGYDDKNEVLGRPAVEFWQSKEKAQEIIEALQRGESVIGELVARRKDCSFFDVQLSACAVTDETGTPVYMMSSFIDITERKKAEEALRESENKYKAVVDNAIEGIVVVQDGMLKFVNPKLVSVVGYSIKELTSRPFIEFIHPEHKEGVMGIHIKRLKGEEVPTIYEFKVFDKDGNAVWVENNGILIKWGGRPATLNFLRDITERKKAEHTIWTSESEKKSILNAISDQILFHDTDLVIRWGNEAAARSVGMAQRELVGCYCYELWHSRSEPCERCPVLRAIETGSHAEGIITTPDERRWEVIGEPVCDRDGKIKGAIEIARDITDRKKVEEKLLDYQAKLKSLSSQLTLTEERERHQIATELHATIGQSLVVSKLQLDTLRASVPSGDLARTLDEVCNSLNQTIQNARSLTFDLGSPILYELGFETAVAEWLTERIQKKHGIATELEDDGQPKPLNDDIRAFLFRDVRELLINVVKHANAKSVKVSIRKVGEQICVSVEDDGGGFNVEDIAVIAARKSGFGLFSIRERLEQLWGQFEIESEPGRGTKVTMTAPLKCEKITDGA